MNADLTGSGSTSLHILMAELMIRGDGNVRHSYYSYTDPLIDDSDLPEVEKKYIWATLYKINSRRINFKAFFPVFM